MNKLIRGMLVLVIVAGTMVVTASADDAAVPDEWKSLDVAGLTSLARQFRAKREAGVEDCKRLAAYVAERYAAAGQVDWNEWLGLASLLGSYYPSATREAMAQNIQQKLAPDQATVSKMTTEQMMRVRAALKYLGQADSATSICVIWTNGTDVWQSLGPRQLGFLATGLFRAGEAGKSARQRVADHITAKYLTDSAKIRSVKAYDWRILSGYLHADMSAETCAAWAVKIRAAFADASVLRTMKAGEVRSLASALRSLGDKQAYGLVATWVEGTDAWQSLEHKALVSLAKSLFKTGEAGKAARQRLTEHITAKYFKDTAATRSVGPRNWRILSSYLRKDMSSEARAAWVDKICAAYTDAAVLASLKADEVRDLVKAVTLLAHGQSYGSVAKWIEESDAWQSLEPGVLALLAGDLSKAGEVGKAARQRLVEHITAKYLADSAKTRSVKPHNWRAFASCLRHEMSPQTCVTWAEKLRAAFENQSVLIPLKVGEVRHLAAVLLSLGDGQAYGLVATWVEGTDAWQSLEPEALASLANSLFISGEAGKSARQRLAEHVAAKYFKDTAATRSAKHRHWRHLVRYLGEDLSMEDRQLWAGKLRGAFAGSHQAVAAMNAQEFNEVIGAIASLDRGQAADLALQWLENRDEWVQSPVGDLVLMGDLAAKSAQADKRRQIMARLEEVWSAKSSELSWKHRLSISLAWLSVPDKSKTQQWAMKAYESAVGTEQARASVTARDLRLLGRLLSQVGLTGNGKGYQAFAAALAGLARRGKLVSGWPSWYYQLCALPLGTAEARQTLQAELTDSENNPRPTVAEIMAWAYRSTGELKAWQGLLDGKIATAGMGGDTKARWMLARAFAESIVPREPSPLRGKKWLDQALATATSSSCRMDALREIVHGYAAIGKHDKGLAVLDSISGQFAGTDEAADVEALRTETQKSKAEWAAVSKRQAEEVAAERKRLYKAELQRRLDAARAKGDQEAIRRYKRLLGIAQ